jgi:uncharacterized membrane protein HdeD (DUF308 family)
MSGHVDLNQDPIDPIPMYPSWYYYAQSLLMVITGLVLLVIPVHSSKLTSGVITIYLFLLGVVSILSVISDRSGMGWKFFIGIVGITVGIVSVYYFYNNIYTFTETFFLIFLAIMCLIIGIIQIMRGLSFDDPLIRLIGVNTGVIGLIIIPGLYFSEWWTQDIIGIMLIIGGLACYFLKNARRSGREQASRSLRRT